MRTDIGKIADLLIVLKSMKQEDLKDKFLREKGYDFGLVQEK